MMSMSTAESVRVAADTWRLAAERKARLEERASMTGRSIAQVLDELVDRGLDRQAEDEDADRERQRALHDRARR